MSKQDKKPAGFTLLELLVVLGVIGVLMSLLLPQIMETRRQARNMQCCGNYRGIGQTLLNYATDYDGNLPKTGAYGQQWSQVNYCLPSWKGNSNPIIANFGRAGSPDIRAVVQGYVPTKFSFKTWQCPFIDGPPMGDIDSTTGNYRQTLGIDSSSGAVGANLFLTFAAWYGNTSAPPPAGADPSMIEAFWKGGWVDKVEGFPGRIAQAVPGLVLAQDLFCDVGWDYTGLMKINHLVGGDIQSHASNATPGTCNNIVQGTAVNLALGAKASRGCTRGLGATAVFYDGSARLVPASELVQVSNQQGGHLAFRIWSVLP